MGAPEPHSTKPPRVARTDWRPFAAARKFRAFQEKTASTAAPVGLWNAYSSPATGSDAPSASPGSNGLQPVSSTARGTPGSASVTVPNGKRARNVADRKRGSPYEDAPSPLAASGRP